MDDRELPLEELLAGCQGRVEAGRRALFCDFARVFLRGLDRHSLSREREAGGERALQALLEGCFERISIRAPGERRVSVSNPEDRPGRTVVWLLQDDRSFIVDSVRMLLQARGLRERFFLHPILAVRRDADGRLEAVGHEEDGAAESALYIEVSPRIASAGQRADLEAALVDLMGTVEAVTGDHPRMIRAVREICVDVDFAARTLPNGEERVGRVSRLLEWLVGGQFVLMGFRRYGLRWLAAGDSGPGPRNYEIWLERGSGLGLFRGDGSSRLLDPVPREQVPEELRDLLEDPRILVVDKSHVESRIHRPGRLDRITVMLFDESGRERGFAIVHGLFTLRALRTPSSQVPLLSDRLKSILAAEGARPGSHRHRALFSAFDSAPAEVLLSTSQADNAALIREIVDAEGSKQARIVLRQHRTRRSAYVAVMLPRERYAEQLRERVRQLLGERIGAAYIDDRISFIGEGMAVLHFFCMSSSGPLTLPEHAVLEAEIAERTASWDDRAYQVLRSRFGEDAGTALMMRYETAFSPAFRALTDPRDSVRDVEALERLHATGQPQIVLSCDSGRERQGTTWLRIYLPEARLLSDVLPFVDHFGIQVIDAQQIRVRPVARPEASIEALRILPLGADQADLDAISERVGEALVAVLTGEVPDDPLNGLVLGAGLDWRQVDCVRAYLEYFLQIQGTLMRVFVSSVLLQNPQAVRILVQLVEARFDPALAEAERSERVARLEQAFEAYRDRISSLNEDRALAGIYGLVQATLRSSLFAPAREPHRTVFKLDPARVPELSGQSPPYREIFVHSARMLGIHIRGGPVARGGLRWSDRSDDLRVEILELMRTQTLKNGIIAPVGAKGGFVLRRRDLSQVQARKHADEQYRVFVASLLEITDNLDAEGRVLAPEGVRALDGADPYLVVAADKGTAHLSDTANELALARDFWLGDAFASGGSVGYDHKKYAITARGAWECVKHHFAGLGIDPERDDYSMAGIGDMSGDVFGNGLLLARRARLLAAFDHRHVFLDPDPDPEIAWAERRRLFELPASSWADYDASLVSEGGGVFQRSAKSIPLSARMRERLGIGPDGEPLSGADVVRAVLAMPVDLLWNGGIGTYVKSASESHADAGDRANDSVRIDACELRARVVAEGGNLGFTQAARVEAALRGVCLDTDAIDNSAGVDLSDHEVNYKILLAPGVRSGTLSSEKRRAALQAVAEAACESVLAHNRGQVLALTLDQARSRQDLASFTRAIDHWCASPEVDRAELQLPDAVVLAERAASGQGLTRPELAVLLGLAKLQARRALAASPLVELAYFEPSYHEYFPEALRSAFREALAAHRLRREITALSIGNRLLDAGGATLLPGLTAELGVGIPEAVAAVLFAEDVLAIPRLRAWLATSRAGAEGGGLATAAFVSVLLDMDRAVRDVARLLARSGECVLEAPRLERLRRGLAELRGHLPQILSEGERSRSAARRQEFASQGLSEELAGELSALPLAERGLEILRVCEGVAVSPLVTARVYARLGEATGIDWVYQRLPQVQARDEWESLTLADLRSSLLDLQRGLCERILATKPDDPARGVEDFLQSNAPLLAQVRGLQQRALSTGSASALAVVARRLRALLSPPSN